jgi:hypothetical protein
MASRAVSATDKLKFNGFPDFSGKKSELVHSSGEPARF